MRIPIDNAHILMIDTWDLQPDPSSNAEHLDIRTHHRLIARAQLSISYRDSKVMTIIACSQDYTRTIQLRQVEDSKKKSDGLQVPVAEEDTFNKGRSKQFIHLFEVEVRYRP